MKFIQQRWRGLAIWAIIIGLLMAYLIPLTLQARRLEQTSNITSGQVLRSWQEISGSRSGRHTSYHIEYKFTDQTGHAYIAASIIPQKDYFEIRRWQLPVEVRYLADDPTHNEPTIGRSEFDQMLLWITAAMFWVILGFALWAVAWPNPKAGNEWEPHKP